jgi:hypothetical protein
MIAPDKDAIIAELNERITTLVAERDEARAARDDMAAKVFHASRRGW